MVGTEKTAYILFGFDKYGSKYNGQLHSPRTVLSEITNKHFHRTITVKLTDFIQQRLLENQSIITHQRLVMALSL